jgi:hypothetical protein
MAMALTTLPHGTSALCVDACKPDPQGCRVFVFSGATGARSLQLCLGTHNIPLYGMNEVAP